MVWDGHCPENGTAKIPKLPSELLDHYIYGIVSDGDLMEGISTEAASLAGHLLLNNIIYFYNDNSITIEGKTDLAFAENIEENFKALGWQLKIDGHNHVEIEQAIIVAQNNQGHPSIIIAITYIANSSPGKSDSEKAHGSPLGQDEVTATKENHN